MNTAAHTLMAVARRLPAALVFFVAVGVALAPSASAQTIDKKLTRSFDGNPYQSNWTFFTALSSEGVLTFSRVIGTCPDLGNTCVNGSTCLSGICVGGLCTGPVPVFPTVGEVALVPKALFCTEAACGNVNGGSAYIPAECLPAPACPTACPIPDVCQSCALAPGFCMCDGHNQCYAPDANFTAGQATFDDGFRDLLNTNAWTFSQSSIVPSATDGYLKLGVDSVANPGAANSIAFASTRFSMVPGQEYVLILKNSYVPLVGGLQCSPYASLVVHFEGRAPLCDQDQDGYTRDVDCNDDNGTIHPGQLDTSCNSVDEDCDGVADDDYVSTPDRWQTVAHSGVISGRSGHTLIAAGNTAIAWGGVVAANGTLTSTGAIFTPAKDDWIAMPTNSAPAARQKHTAVWTGSQMIVWGGLGATAPLMTGAVFDSSLGSIGAWRGPTTLSGAPPARFFHTAIWTGSQMIVWGGRDGSGNLLNSGALYDPVADRWTPLPTANAPTGRWRHTAVWTGRYMVVWGGETASGITNTGGIYDSTTNTWTATVTTSPAPSPRADHVAVWSGTVMYLFGGLSPSGSQLNDGGRLNVTGNKWGTIPTLNAPSGRSTPAADWNGTGMMIWGGTDKGDPLGDGAILTQSPFAWTPITSLNAPSPRAAPGAWVGGLAQRFVVWGGYGTRFFDDGGQYQPFATCGLGICQRSAGTVCASGSINYVCTAGAPQPEVCNSQDDDCNGLIDDGVPPVADSPLLTAGYAPGGGDTDLLWSALPNSQAGDLVRGSLQLLHSTLGDYTIATQKCVVDDSVVREGFDSDIPSVGDGFWYLARDVNYCSGPGTYDAGSPYQVGFRDAEIAASGRACP